MRPETLCMGCMMPKGAPKVCAECGWVEGTAPESSLQLPPRTVLNDTYLLGKVLGQGGFGVTYLAWHLQKQAKRAVKEYLPQQLAERAKDGRTVRPSNNQNREPFSYGLKKFVDEAQTLERLAGHPNIVEVQDFFKGNGTAYLVMSFLEGITLKQYLEDKNGKIPFEAALKILIPVMDALREVHAAEILHRDVSPDNIYLCYSGPVKLLDFGATKQLIGVQSQSLAAIFKEGYTPIEQYQSEGKQGPWTDVYALGATTYRTVTGRTPPKAWDRLYNDEIKPPSRLGASIPPQPEAALMRALAVRPEQRFKTVVEFQSALLAEQPSPLSVPVLTKPVPRLSKRLFLGLYAVGWGLFDVLVIASQIQLRWGSGESPGWAWLSWLALFANVLVLLALVHKMWGAIGDGSARRSPGEAVGLSLVPVYGVFPGLWSFAKEYNAYLSRHSLRAAKLPGGLFLAYAIISCAVEIAAVLALAWPLVVPALVMPGLVAHYFTGTIMVSYIADAVGAVKVTSALKSGSKKLQLYCVSGEIQGNDVDVPTDGLIIGRNPRRANIVLTSDLVSGAHTRVWLDPAGSGVWVEDLKSTNGTEYSEPGPGGSHGEWIQLSERKPRKLLTRGGRFRLGDDRSEFEVRGA